MISEFKAGDKIEQPCLVRLQKIGTSSNGKAYAKGLLEDNSGCVPFICFEAGPINRLKSIDVPRPFVIGGNVDVNKFSTDMSLQVIVQKAEHPGPKDSIDNLLPRADIDLEDYKKQFDGLINKITDPGLSKLVKLILSGETYEQMLINPAGMRLHHAYIGGLLQHTVNVSKLALAMAQAIGEVDEDLVLAGTLLHDVGKLQEISPELGFPYTTPGRMMGHISIGAMEIAEIGKKIKELPKERLDALVHIILSHHGEQEKGSPIACATKESFIVHYADETDAIMNQYQNMKKHNWEYNKMLQRYLYKS
jgi:3'-5' exoribonuclease